MRYPICGWRSSTAAPRRSAARACAGSPPGGRACRGRGGCPRGGRARPPPSVMPSRSASRAARSATRSVPVDVAVARASTARAGWRLRVRKGATGAPLPLPQLSSSSTGGAVRGAPGSFLLLRAVERGVGELDQLDPVVRVRGYAAMPTLMLDGAEVAEAERGDAPDRTRRPRPPAPRRGRDQDRELVAAEPERLAVLAEAGRELGEHLVADRMAEGVVDALEVVDVEAGRGRGGGPSPAARGLALEALVEVLVAEPRRGGRRGHRCAQLAEVQLVERDRHQQADQRDREARASVPTGRQGPTTPSAIERERDDRRLHRPCATARSAVIAPIEDGRR